MTPRNQLVKLQIKGEIWLDLDDDINAHLHDYFLKLFTADGPRAMEEALAGVTPMISRELNSLHTRPVTDQKIKSTMFQLGAGKALGPDNFSGMFY